MERNNRKGKEDNGVLKNKLKQLINFGESELTIEQKCNRKGIEAKIWWSDRLKEYIWEHGWKGEAKNDICEKPKIKKKGIKYFFFERAFELYEMNKSSFEDGLFYIVAGNLDFLKKVEVGDGCGNKLYGIEALAKQCKIPTGFINGKIMEVTLDEIRISYDKGKTWKKLVFDDYSANYKEVDLPKDEQVKETRDSTNKANNYNEKRKRYSNEGRSVVVENKKPSRANEVVGVEENSAGEGNSAGEAGDE